MAEKLCEQCGVGMNYILMRNGTGWCHVLGGTACKEEDLVSSEKHCETCHSWGVVAEVRGASTCCCFEWARNEGTRGQE